MEIKQICLILIATLSMGLLFFLLSMLRRKKPARTSEQVTTTSPSLDSGSGRDFEVFLNFRGPDSRRTVVDVLYNALIRAGIRVFYDDEEIRKGELIEGELLSAITHSRIYIPIFSKDYASSAWCLRELAKMMECWRNSSGGEMKKVILPVFYNVDVSKDLKLRSDLYLKGLKKHKKRLGKAAVEPWEAALKEVATISGWNLEDHGLDELKKIIVDEVCGKLQTRSEGKMDDNLVGIQRPMEDIMKLLGQGTSDVRFVVIHGLGGIGKTTLANCVFNQISHQFQEGCIFLSDIRESSRIGGGIMDLQKELLSKILDLRHVPICDADDGVNMIKERLKNKKVLIVLDNLYENNQLLKLAGSPSWFGKGSIIIITTRNVGCLVDIEAMSGDGSALQNIVKHEGFYLYKMPLMQPDDALKLFSRHAFKSDSPPFSHGNISSEVVNATGGLPLAIVVIGPLFFGRKEDVWKDKLEKMRKVVNEDVRKKLMISIDELDNQEREIFLDIACLFINKEREDATHYWEAQELHPISGLNTLINLSLIEIMDGNKFWMHDLIRDLGKKIVNEENPKILGRRSRLWLPEEAFDVVKKKKGTEDVVALNLGRHYANCSFTHEQFSKLTNLKFLELDGGNLNGEFTGDFSELRWLSWDNCPMRIEANLSFQKLVVLKLSGCQITNNLSGCGPITVGKQLKVLKLTNCTFFTKTFDFSTFLGLERLIITDCHGLEEIDKSITMLKYLCNLEILNDSRNFIGKPNFVPRQLPPDYIGYLKCLTVLKLDDVGLRKLHHSIGELVNLKCLHLRCPQLENLPNSIGKLMMLVELDISDSGIKELPDTIDGFKQLKILNMWWSAILHLPDLIGGLESLEELNLDDTKITALPDSIGELKRLTDLHIQRSAILHLPDSIGRLESLGELNLNGTKIAALPDSIGELKRLGDLNMERSAILHLPDSIGRLESLEELDLDDTKIIALPDSIGELKRLTYLRMQRSEILYLPDSIGRLESLEELNLDDTKMAALPDSIGELKRLIYLRMQRSAILHLPDSIGRLESLKKLNLDNTKITALPDSIGELKQLRILSMKKSAILHLPDSIGRLESLNELNLQGAKLTALLDFGDPMNLRSLGVSFSLLESYNRERDLSSFTNFCQKLDFLTLDFSDDILASTDLSSLSSLKSSTLHGVESLSELQLLSSLNNLSSLKLYKCPHKKFQVDDLEQLSNLKSLILEECVFLEELSNLSCLKKLQRLEINRCRHLIDIQGLGEVETLEFLRVEDTWCMQRLPDLSNLKKLRNLYLILCKSLDSIPDVDEEAPCELRVDECEHFDDYWGDYKKLIKRKEGKKERKIKRG